MTENPVNIPNDPPSVDPSKQEFMTACLADGNDKEKCTAMWTASHQTNPEVPPQPTASGDVDLLRKIDMLEARVALREKQLKQAIGIADRANDERTAKNQAEKLGLIQSIQIDSKFSKDELTKKSLADLQIIRHTLDRSIEKTFANVAADIQNNRKKAVSYTAGYFDSATKTWKGGI